MNVTLAYEGGWAEHPKDPGGATMKGVTLATFRRWKPGATKTDLRNISTETLQKIYRADYWEPVKGDTLARGVDLATFDYGVNSGPATARKQLLKVLGGTDAETVKRLCKARLSSYQSFKTWITFGKGWTVRVTAVEAKGVAWSLVADAPVDAPTPSPAEALKAEGIKAASTAKIQGNGGYASAGGAGGGVATPTHADNLDQLATWLLAGIVVGAIALAVYLLWRSHINKKRAEAYRAEAAIVESGAA
nr:glycosyl hydrolase 108 family protein [Tianweitania aestuarii]